MSAGLEQLQREFAAHLRDPAQASPPPGIEPRRLRIYSELVYNNLEGFVAAGFPVLKSLLEPAAWATLLRAFLARHDCQTPYFLRIGEEFLDFLQQAGTAQLGLPPFALELAHYEWVELALDVAEARIDAPGIDPAAELRDGVPVLSPLAWPLSYQFAVHRICAAFQPQRPDAAPTCLVVYRNRDENVKFLETNPPTLRMLAMLDEQRFTGRQIAAALAVELGQAGSAAVEAAALQTLERLRELHIVAGVRAGVAVS